MNKYPAYSVIERNGVVAIIVGWHGSVAEIMVEDGRFGVAFRNYQISDVSLFRVIG